MLNALDARFILLGIVSQAEKTEHDGVKLKHNATGIGNEPLRAISGDWEVRSDFQ